MKIETLFFTLLGLAAWSLSNITVADWDTGACPGGGSAPCIETEINDNTYHFNGTGGHTDTWHSRPAAEGGGDFVFEGDAGFYCSLNLNCTLAWSGEIKKCQDSNGDWRIGFQINSASMSNGSFCSLYILSNFPWYLKEPSLTPHCPFVDNCDDFIPYDATASSYTANLGRISLTAIGIGLVNEEHLHSVAFTPGLGASFDFSSNFYDCDESSDCSFEGELIIDNATSLDIQ
ncbi:hypothetical protein ACLD02_10525 [Alloalcanivorax sp. C16-2]|uniref:hypothetical protein n=1 Tax=Alloalcanivorax sp. C16-2 TaxID=3390052 RepID=UPI003970EC99